MEQKMDQATREDWEDRLLGVKVCIQDLLEIMEQGPRYKVFDKALDLALKIEQELLANGS